MKLNSTVKRTVGAVAASVPRSIAEPFLKVAALAPPVLKTQNFESLCAKMSQAPIYRDRLIETNLGIVSRLRCRIPIQKSQYAFGRPDNGVTECCTLRLLRELVKDCRHFLDVGAHEGIYTFVVAVEGKGTINSHWFEPDSTLSARLSGNLQRNHVTAYGNRVAASDENGEATFFRNLRSDLSGSLGTVFRQWHATKPETVETVRLSDYVRKHGVSRAMVKVDVEGTGAQVWSGLADCFHK
jgi:FkbM family methyltransferase